MMECFQPGYNPKARKDLLLFPLGHLQIFAGKTPLIQNPHMQVGIFVIGGGGGGDSSCCGGSSAYFCYKVKCFFFLWKDARMV